MVIVKVKGRNAVHESSGLQDSGHILEDGKSMCNTTLNMFDLSTKIMEVNKEVVPKKKNINDAGSQLAPPLGELMKMLFNAYSGHPPSKPGIEDLERQCNGIPLKFCHVEHGRVSFFSFNRVELPVLP